METASDPIEFGCRAEPYVNDAPGIFRAGIGNVVVSDDADVEKRPFLTVGKRTKVSDLRRQFGNGTAAFIRGVSNVSADA